MFKWLFCKHRYTFVRNIYGDMIIHSGFKRSVWKCEECGKVNLLEELYKEEVSEHG